MKRFWFSINFRFDLQKTIKETIKKIIYKTFKIKSGKNFLRKTISYII